MRKSAVLLRARYVSRMLAFAAQRGLDPRGLVESCGLPEAALVEEEPLVSLEALRALGPLVQARLGEPRLGVELARSLSPGDYGAIAFLARASASLSEALESFAAHATALNASWSVTVESSRAEARLKMRIPKEPDALGEFGNAYFIGGLVVIARQLAGEDVRLERAWLAHEGPPPPGFEALVGAPVAMGRGENGLAVSDTYLRRPLGSADPELRKWLGQLVGAKTRPPDDPHAQLREVLRAALPKILTLEEAARALAQSARTLQRRLADDGTSFAAILEQVRRELADELLSQGTAVQEVSYRLGYADPRAFARAHRRWTGRAPGEVRARGGSER